MYINLKNKIKSKQAKISIIGLGYVGLPIFLEFLKNGFYVIGIDRDIKKIKLLRKGISYIDHINTDLLNKNKKNFECTNKFSEIKNADIIIICLPTPIKKNNSPEMKYLKSSVVSLRNNLKKGQALILESTTYPGTTEEIYEPILKKLGFKIGRDFFLIYSPEREDPGNKKFNIKNTVKVISGKTKNCKNIAYYIYSSICKKIHKVSNIRTAEMTKLYENIFRSINIGLANEMKVILEKFNINIYEVINAAKSKPFGFMPFYPGPGLGGHCIPIDPFILSWKARKLGINTQFIKLSGIINRSMPKRVFKKTRAALNINNIKKKKVLVLGVSYKKDIDDIRESPALEIIKIFRDKKFIVDYSDPYFKKIPKMRNYKINLTNKKLTSLLLKKYSAVILVTDHAKFNYNFIYKNSKIIIDTRGKFKDSPKVYRA